MRRWNALKALAFMTWFRKSKVIHKKKQFRMISNSIDHSIPSATSQKLRLWLLGTLNYARLSTWNRSCNGRHVLNIAMQESNIAHLDILWQMILPRTKSTSQPCLIRSPSLTSRSGRTIQLWKSTWMQRTQYGESTCKKMPQKRVRQHPRSTHPR